MVLTGYNYHEKPFKKGDLNNPFPKQKRSSKKFCSINRGKSGEKTFDRDKSSLRTKVLSPHVTESTEVLDSGFQPSGFRIPTKSGTLAEFLEGS